MARRISRDTRGAAEGTTSYTDVVDRDTLLRLGDQAVLVPVKAFGQAKERLGPTLSRTERSRLARAMATTVLGAAAPLPVAVVCDDPDVAQWARSLGALVVWEPGRGLNGAVEAGICRLTEAGVTQVTVAHGDLPLAENLIELGTFAGITLVPDRAGNGTNVISLPTKTTFRFSYGPGSFARHLAEAELTGLAVRVLHDERLASDVDEPGDLAFMAGLVAPPTPPAVAHA